MEFCDLVWEVEFGEGMPRCEWFGRSPGVVLGGLVVNSIRIGFGCGGAIWRKVEVEVGFW